MHLHLLPLAALLLISPVIAGSTAQPPEKSSPKVWRHVTTEMASAVKQGWGETRTDSAIGGGPMSIAGQRYAKGLGTYDVMLDSTAMAGESEVTVTAGDATLTGKFPKTENWDDYKTASIGQLTFRQSGVFTLSFKPASVATWRPLNLRNVILKPSNK